MSATVAAVHGPRVQGPWETALRALLRIEFADGPLRTVASDADWRGAIGAILEADKARLTTAAGSRVQVRIKQTEHGGVKVKLRDKDRNSRNPRAILDALDINKGNKQIAHAIVRVLRSIVL